MPPKRVHPDFILELWVPHADVPGHAFGEALAREEAEGGSGVDEDMPAVLERGGKGGDAWECVGVAWERRLGILILILKVG
jgi:hypothetical protein